jgi:hypothetical protein
VTVGYESAGNEVESNLSLGSEGRTGVTAGSISTWYSALSASESLRSLRTGVSSSPQTETDTMIPRATSGYERSKN